MKIIKGIIINPKLIITFFNNSFPPTEAAMNNFTKVLVMHANNMLILPVV